MPNATVWELSALREHDIGTHMVKTLLSAVAVLVLMIGAQSAFAIPENQSGYNHWWKYRSNKHKRFCKYV